MEGRAKVTKEILCEEARFILANVIAEAGYGRSTRYDDIRRRCENDLSIPYAEYVAFLEASSYLRRDRATEIQEVTSDGEAVVSGDNLADFTERAVAYFKKLRQTRGPGATDGIALGGPPSAPPGSSQAALHTPTGVTMPSAMDRTTTTVAAGREGSGAQAMPRRDSKPHVAPSSLNSGGRSSAAVGGEIVELDQDRYEKVALIGSGGIGTVYRARQAALGRDVVLKEIRELFGFFNDEQRVEIVRRFGEVVRTWAQLSHNNILPIYDVSLDAEFPYVVTELAANGSVRRLISDAETIPVEVVFKYLLQALFALRAAHARDVHHRGLKPEQLLIDAHGNLRVADFGFSRIVERDHAVIRQIYVGMGNVAYMAPELYTDPGSASAQGDIYALGIIFYEMLARKLPGRRSPMPSQILSSLPPAIDDIFDKMTRDARAERYATIDDILNDISNIEGFDALSVRSPLALDENPLAGVTFKAGAEDPVPGISMEPDDDGDRNKSSTHRPYSYQQRRNQSTKAK
ncbi:MAG: serine/threonine-protein kinase [Kofleriaceae bacterium]